jgi:hypothetical protein
LHAVEWVMKSQKYLLYFLFIVLRLTLFPRICTTLAIGDVQPLHIKTHDNVGQFLRNTIQLYIKIIQNKITQNHLVLTSYCETFKFKWLHSLCYKNIKSWNDRYLCIIYWYCRSENSVISIDTIFQYRNCKLYLQRNCKLYLR